MASEEHQSKSQRREEARAAALRLREEQQRQTRRRRNLIVAVGLVAVAAFVVLVLFITREADKPPLEGVALVPQGSTSSGAIPVGPDGVAGVTEGAAEDAVVVAVYSDYICPICARFEEINGATLDELRATGDVVLEYHPIALLDGYSLDSRYSTRAAIAAALVADQAPDMFLAFHGALLAGQPAENTEGLDGAGIAEIAREAGVPEELAALIESDEYLGTDTDDPTTFGPWVKAATEQAVQDMSRPATPTIMINGTELDTEKYDWSQEGVLAKAIEDARG
jgi:protein-disulfide isomerase